MPQTTTQQRNNWKHFECNPGTMMVIDFGPDRIRVAPPTVDAWHALATVLAAHNYNIRVDDTDSYNCRAIKGGTGRSLHSYGIALDINASTNPFRLTPNQPDVKYSSKPTQFERGQEVKLGIADTDMTPEMINDVLAIQTTNGKRVFEWGGNWKDRKDAMHFELDLSPEELQAGINFDTVKKPSGPGPVAREPQREPDAVDLDDTSGLSRGARGEAVRQLQLALQKRGFQVGQLDGVFGPLTQAAVTAFQASENLPETGVADEATMQALARGPVVMNGGGAMKPEDILRLLFSALAQRDLAGGTAPVPQAPGTINSQQILQLVLAALTGQQLAVTRQQPAVTGQQSAQPVALSPTSPSGTVPPVLSPIDKALGGEMLAGKKTPLAVLAYTVLGILQSVDVAGTATGPTATPTGQILTTLIGSFGALGLLGKVDRIVQMLGLIAAKPK